MAGFGLSHGGRGFSQGMIAGGLQSAVGSSFGTPGSEFNVLINMINWRAFFEYEIESGIAVFSQ